MTQRFGMKNEKAIYGQKRVGIKRLYIIFCGEKASCGFSLELSAPEALLFIYHPWAIYLRQLIGLLTSAGISKFEKILTTC